MGGGNEQPNLVKLTPKQHYICHLLLTKMTKGNNLKKAWYAFRYMHFGSNSNTDRYLPNSSRFYSLAREQHAKNMSEYLKGRIFSEGSKLKMSNAQKQSYKDGKNGLYKINNSLRSSTHCENISKAKKGKIAYIPSAETKQKISEAHKGKIHSNEHNDKISDSLKGSIPWNKGLKLPDSYKRKHSQDAIAKMKKPRPKVQCPHCLKVGGLGAMKRYHFDNCKMIPLNTDKLP